MRQLIENTVAFKALDLIAQKMILKRANRIQVEEEIVIARNIGLDVWGKQTPLQERWKKIVIVTIKQQ